MAEKARDEAIDMLNSTQKELELVRKNDTQPTFQVPRPNELSGMPIQQLFQLQQKIKQDLQCVEEVHLFYYAFLLCNLHNKIHFFHLGHSTSIHLVISSFVHFCGGSYQVK